MNLDFTKCKTKEDVDKVWAENKKGIEVLKKLGKKLKDLEEEKAK